jgi:hypothetical protein
MKSHLVTFVKRESLENIWWRGEFNNVKGYFSMVVEIALS